MTADASNRRVLILPYPHNLKRLAGRPPPDMQGPRQEYPYSSAPGLLFGDWRVLLTAWCQSIDPSPGLNSMKTSTVRIMARQPPTPGRLQTPNVDQIEISSANTLPHEVRGCLHGSEIRAGVCMPPGHPLGTDHHVAFRPMIPPRVTLTCKPHEYQPWSRYSILFSPPHRRH